METSARSRSCPHTVAFLHGHHSWAGKSGLCCREKERAGQWRGGGSGGPRPGEALAQTGARSPRPLLATWDIGGASLGCKTKA